MKTQLVGEDNAYGGSILSSRRRMLVAAQRRRSGMRPERALLGGHPYAAAVEQILAGLPDLLPGEARRARELALAVVGQGVWASCRFAPGSVVRNRQDGRTAVVVGNKPAAFVEAEGWDHYLCRPLPRRAWGTDLVWTVEPRQRDGGISQSLADDWTIVLAPVY